jgi:hypothetical protein
MSNWTHPQCEACWIASETTIVSYGTLEIRRPHMLIGPGIEMCCYCGKPTIVGIYRRADPAMLEHCGGGHDVDADTP